MFVMGKQPRTKAATQYSYLLWLTHYLLKSNHVLFSPRSIVVLGVHPNSLFAFEEKHFPTVNDLGEVEYPTDPQDFDDNVKIGIGQKFFEIDRFDNWFEEISEELAQEKCKDKKADQSKIIVSAAKEKSECRKQVREEVSLDFRKNKDKYWKDYIGGLVSEDDKEAREAHWNAYLDWTDNNNLPALRWKVNCSNNT